ncbi:hypothetical protein RYX56_22965, partial [Alkalihalophilus lindianensis]
AKDEYLLPSIFHSLKKIAAEHIEQTRKAEEGRLSSVFDRLNELSDQEKAGLMDSFHKLTSELKDLDQAVLKKEKKFEDESNQILKNA